MAGTPGASRPSMPLKRCNHPQGQNCSRENCCSDPFLVQLLPPLGGCLSLGGGGTPLGSPDQVLQVYEKEAALTAPKERLSLDDARSQPTGSKWPVPSRGDKVPKGGPKSPHLRLVLLPRHTQKSNPIAFEKQFKAQNSQLTCMYVCMYEATDGAEFGGPPLRQRVLSPSLPALPLIMGNCGNLGLS